MFLASLRPASHRSSLLERVLDDACALSVPSLSQSPLSRLNLHATEDEVSVTVQVPGIELASIECSLHHDQLEISARRQSPLAGSPASAVDSTSDTATTAAKTATVIWHRHERSEQAFRRSVTLPYPVDPDHTVARVVDGVLTITARRRDADRPRRITVNAA